MILAVNVASFAASSYASTDASLSSTWMLDSSNPVLDKLSNISAPKEGNGTSKKRSFQSQMKVQEEFDSRLVFYVLKEGQFLIDGKKLIKSFFYALPFNLSKCSFVMS